VPVVALLSLRPRFSSAIFAEKKTIELRKSAMKIKPGDQIMIYETTPMKAIAGYTQVKSIFKYSPNDNFRFTDQELALLWEHAKHGCCVKEEEFYSYYRTARYCFMIFLGMASRYSQQIPLREMREQGINPPQCVQYLSEEQVASLISSSEARFL